MSAADNLDFVPRLIESVGIRTGEGATIRLSMAIVQRTAALRAYNNYGNCRDWMDKLSTAYVVAVATRSAKATPFFYLNSAGGDVEAAIAIGRQLRRIGATTLMWDQSE